MTECRAGCERDRWVSTPSGRAHDKIDRFGVRLIRNPLGLPENELLMETCDFENRTLQCSVEQRNGGHTVKSIETSWQSKNGPKVVQACMGFCSPTAMGAHFGAHRPWDYFRWMLDGSVSVDHRIPLLTHAHLPHVGSVKDQAKLLMARQIATIAAQHRSHLRGTRPNAESRRG
jgi:hypothetical protein